MPGGVNSPVRAFSSVGGTPLFIKEGKVVELNTFYRYGIIHLDINRNRFIGRRTAATGTDGYFNTANRKQAVHPGCVDRIAVGIGNNQQKLGIRIQNFMIRFFQFSINTNTGTGTGSIP